MSSMTLVPSNIKHGTFCDKRKCGSGPPRSINELFCQGYSTTTDEIHAWDGYQHHRGSSDHDRGWTRPEESGSYDKHNQVAVGSQF